jgi:hypothetical protein
MKKTGIKPRIRPALDLRSGEHSYRKVLKFKRSWIAIVVLAVFDAVFLIPAITTFQQAASAWSGFNNLFDLVGALFLTAWLMGWSIAPLAMTTILLLLLFGREVLKMRGDRLVVFIGIPGVGVEMEYAVPAMRNYRFERPVRKSAKSWRGGHLVFDYGANSVAVGSDISGDEAIDIKHHIQDASGQTIRRGDATQAELAGEWKTRTESVADSTALPESFAPTVSAKPVGLASPSTLALVFANLVPLAGAAFLGWDLGLVMVLYWAESAVIGFFNICKIIVIGRWASLLAAPFFAGHFGGFMAVHFLFINVLFIQGFDGDNAGDLQAVAQMFTGLWPALALLFISHALSFFMNFLGRKEYLDRTVNTQMSEPYQRIVFMHLVLIFGGGLSLVLGESTLVLMLVIIIKIWVDVRAHLNQRAKNQESKSQLH